MPVFLRIVFVTMYIPGEGKDLKFRSDRYGGVDDGYCSAGYDLERDFC